MATQRNPHRRKREVTDVVTAVDTDGSGQFTHTVGDLRSLDGPEQVDASAAGGYVVNCVSVSDNTATFELRYGGGAGAELDLVTSGTDVTDVHIRAMGT